MLLTISQESIAKANEISEHAEKMPCKAKWMRYLRTLAEKIDSTVVEYLLSQSEESLRKDEDRRNFLNRPANECMLVLASRLKKEARVLIRLFAGKRREEIQQELREKQSLLSPDLINYLQFVAKIGYTWGAEEKNFSEFVCTLAEDASLQLQNPRRSRLVWRDF